MAESILDVARMQEAGMPVPKNLKQMKNMFRSVLEEYNRHYNDKDRSLVYKLCRLADFLKTRYFHDDDGDRFELTNHDVYDIERKLRKGYWKKALPTEWMYLDDGALSPIEAIAAADKMDDLVSEAFNVYMHYNDGHDFFKPEYFESKLKERRNKFFDLVEQINGLKNILPSKLLEEDAFQQKTDVDYLNRNNIPTAQQIMLDPLLYTEHPMKVVADFAKSLI